MNLKKVPNKWLQEHFAFECFYYLLRNGLESQPNNRVFRVVALIVLIWKVLRSNSGSGLFVIIQVLGFAQYLDTCT